MESASVLWSHILMAMLGAAHVVGGGVSQDSPYFHYANVPSKSEYEFGFNRGNEHHSVSRYEQGRNWNFRTKVQWQDKYGGSGEHYWEYNHGRNKKTGPPTEGHSGAGGYDILSSAHAIQLNNGGHELVHGSLGGEVIHDSPVGGHDINLSGYAIGGVESSGSTGGTIHNGDHDLNLSGYSNGVGIGSERYGLGGYGQGGVIRRGRVIHERGLKGEPATAGGNPDSVKGVEGRGHGIDLNNVFKLVGDAGIEDGVNRGGGYGTGSSSGDGHGIRNGSELGHGIGTGEHGSGDSLKNIIKGTRGHGFVGSGNTGVGLGIGSGSGNAHAIDINSFFEGVGDDNGTGDEGETGGDESKSRQRGRSVDGNGHGSPFGGQDVDLEPTTDVRVAAGGASPHILTF